MKRLFLRICVVLATAGMVNSASAFALLGPIDGTFMTAGIGYNPRGFDVGGPMNLGEGYRWNIKTIYYGFDPSFTRYFGPKGSNAVVQALEILNKLPEMSKVNLASFQTDTRRYNYRAATLGILDLKSFTLGIMMEEMGLASPERYVWCIHNVFNIPPNQYVVIQRNFDPVTIAPSLYVNDTLYYYAIDENIPVGGGVFTDAVEFPVDPLQSYSAVATLVDGDTGFTFTPGLFFTGLTRDDVGGLRYLYKKGIENSYIEPVVTNAIPGAGGGSPFGPGSATNVLVNAAARGGTDKFVFKLAKNETLFGPFVVFTNQNNSETFFTNGRSVKQKFGRTMNLPDIIFAAADLGETDDGFPIGFTRQPNYVNNSALNSTVGALTAGPGTMSPTITITFTKLGPHLMNLGPDALDQGTAGMGFVWGFFDGTTNDPIVFPQPPGEIGLTIQDLLQIIFAP